MRFNSDCMLRRNFTSRAPSGSSRRSAAGSVDERARKCNSLLLSTRELSRPSALVPLQLDDPQHRRDPLLVLALRDSLHPQAERHVVVDRHVREERVLLEDHVDPAIVGLDVGDVLSVQADAARIRGLEPGDHPQGRGLATPRRAEEREELTIENPEVERVDGEVAAEPLADALESNRVAAHGPRHESGVYAARLDRTAGDDLQICPRLILTLAAVSQRGWR